MLSKMFYEGADYDTVLKRGTGERDMQREIRKQMWKDMMHAERLQSFLL